MTEVVWEYWVGIFETAEDNIQNALTTWLNAYAGTGWEPLRMSDWSRVGPTSKREVLLRRPKVAEDV